VATFPGVAAHEFIERDGMLMGFPAESFLPAEVCGTAEIAKSFKLKVTWTEIWEPKLVYGDVGYPVRTGTSSPRFLQHTGDRGTGENYSFAYGRRTSDTSTRIKAPESGGIPYETLPTMRARIADVRFG